jgi:hypothetical protein
MGLRAGAAYLCRVPDRDRARGNVGDNDCSGAYLRPFPDNDRAKDQG